MKKLRLSALLLALALTLGCVPAAAAEGDGWPISRLRDYGSFTDTAGTLYKQAASICCKSGLMDGVDDRHFCPASGLTGAQVIVISARLLERLSGGDLSYFAPISKTGAVWWTPYDGYLTEKLPALGGQTWYQSLQEHPKELCTREQFFRLLAAVLDGAWADLPILNEVTATPDCDDQTILQFYRWGVLGGKDEYGTLSGDAWLTRGAAASMLTRLIDPQQRLTLTLRPPDLCRDVLGVEPDAALLAVNGEEVPAELFAQRLCQSLLQWNGNAEKAVDDAIRLWCKYDAPFRVLAAEAGVALSDGERSAADAEAQARDGLLGSGAAYWRYSLENVSLNLALVRHYTELDWKQGEYNYHQELEARAAALEQSAAQTELLRGLDLRAAYSRLKQTPYPIWVVE